MSDPSDNKYRYISDKRLPEPVPAPDPQEPSVSYGAVIEVVNKFSGEMTWVSPGTLISGWDDKLNLETATRQVVIIGEADGHRTTGNYKIIEFATRTVAAGHAEPRERDCVMSSETMARIEGARETLARMRGDEWGTGQEPSLTCPRCELTTRPSHGTLPRCAHCGDELQ